MANPNDPPDIAIARAKADLDGNGIVNANDFQQFANLAAIVMQYDATHPNVTVAALTTQGRYLLDKCGNRLTLRGYEQRLRNDILLPGGSFSWLIDEIALTKANAVRFLPEINNATASVNVSLQQISDALARAIQNGLIIDLHLDAAWFAQPAVKTMLQPYLGSIIATVFGEPGYDNVTQWKTEAKAAIAAFRAAGYQIPVNVLANNFGRDLPGILNNGAEILASDPFHKTIFGWQAYWNASYQSYYGMTLAQAALAINNAAFPVHMGITYVADTATTVDYRQEMALADQYKISWLYWHYHNRPGFDIYNISTDGYHNHLMAEGNVIVLNDPHSLQNVAPVKACTG
jgi:mannan endo-1,4-beta-mannosidase